MAQEKTESRAESINSIYQQRVDALTAAEDKDREDVEAREEGVEHPDTPLPEEQRFVANPDDLRKDAASEEEFSAGLEDGDDDLAPVAGQDTTKAAKTAKKTAAKK